MMAVMGLCKAVRFRRVFLRVLAGSCCACLAGCAAADSATPTYPVRGTVFCDGQPAAGALVVLSPLDDDAPPQAERPRGYVDQQGVFQLTTRSRFDGAPAGNYAVAVIWRQQPDEDLPPGRYLGGARYADPSTSGLRVEIREGDNELPPFELEPAREL